MPLPALGELPQLTALSLAWRRLVDLKPVLMLVNNTGLVCCWEQRGRWQQRVVAWPEGVCRDGVPLQRAAVGELIADLIFDCDCPGAELVLCLPLEAASWCVVDGYGADGSPGLLPHALQSVELPFECAKSYVTSSPVQEALAVVETTDAEPAQPVVARTQLSLKLSFYDVAPLTDAPANGSTSSPS